jgi:acid phosphatase family membrane protein YuiD
MTELLTTYFPLVASLLSMTVSQTIKLLLMLLFGNTIHLSALTRSGGMPSSHSALITAMTLSMGLKNGFDSNYFFLSVVLSLVVIYDARGIRHTVGQHAKILNQSDLVRKTTPLDEHTGHTLPEISVGISVGLLVSLAMYHLINL